MKVLIAVVITALITSASAFGAATWTRSSNGVVCQTMSTGIGCIKSDATGYGIGISKDFVFVLNAQGKRVFVRYQP